MDSENEVDLLSSARCSRAFVIRGLAQRFNRSFTQYSPQNRDLGRSDMLNDSMFASF